MSGTVSYYDQNAERFFGETVELDMSELYARFLAHVPVGGRILDVGCGSGRDTAYFLRRGFEVEAFDASAEMCRLASALTGQTVLQKTFEQVDSDSAFDGIWACASLLHIRRANMDGVLQKLCQALKPNGVILLSFKLRKRSGSRVVGFLIATTRVLCEYFWRSIQNFILTLCGYRTMLGLKEQESSG